MDQNPDFAPHILFLDILEKHEEHNNNATLLAEVEDKALENVTDVVLCANIYDNATHGDPKLLKEDICFVNLNEDIAALRSKQNQGTVLSEMDENKLSQYYFRRCSAKYEEKYRENSISVEMRLVAIPSQCKSAFVEDYLVLNQVQKPKDIVRIVGFTVTALGLLGAILSLSVFCRPSFLARQHLGYLCIERSIFDIFMLVYCAQTGFTYDISSDQLRGTERPPKAVETVQCCMFFIFFLPSEIGTMLVTLFIALQRLLAVAIPFKAKVILNSGVTKVLCLVILCVYVIVPVICFVVFYVASDFNPSCMIMRTDKAFLFNFLLVWSVIFISVPWLTIVSVNIATLYHIVVARRRRNELTATNPEAQSQSELHMRDLKMVVVMSMSFLVAVAPEILLNVMALIGQSGDVYLFLTSIQIELGTYMILAVKSSYNFFIYFGTNALFRRVILNYTPCCRQES